MGDAGCSSVQIGIQSLDSDYKKKALRRYETTEHIERGLRLLKKNGIGARCDHMLGLPGEPLEAQEKARKFYAKNTPYSIQSYFVCYFPRTDFLE